MMPMRASEIMLILEMIGVGLTLLAPGDTFSLPHYEAARRDIEAIGLTETALGAVVAVIGILRLVAMTVNGESRVSPIVRMIGCALGASFWAWLAVTMLESHWQGIPNLFALASIAAVFEFHALARGAVDAFRLDSLGSRQRERERRLNGEPIVSFRQQLRLWWLRWTANHGH